MHKLNLAPFFPTHQQLIANSNAHFGYAYALVVDESAFAKKGEMSAGLPDNGAGGYLFSIELK